jgi:hypothetical protein
MPVPATHQLTTEADTGDDVLFVCREEGCGRRLVVKRSGGLVVIDRGDFFALHTGGTLGMEVSGAIVS